MAVFEPRKCGFGAQQRGSRLDLQECRIGDLTGTIAVGWGTTSHCGHCTKAATPLDLFKSRHHNLRMETKAIRTSIDLPRDLHRRLHEAAARKGCSARKLILAGIEQAVSEPEPARPQRRLTLDVSLVPPAGRTINPTNEELYDLIEFP